jgi:hypothetical protein
MKDDAISPLRTSAGRLRRGLLWLIFGLILLIPKVNRLRRRRRLWNFVRIVIALAAAAILVLGMARGRWYALLAAGALMLLFALVVRPERREFSIDARARELGVLIVVDGGSYIDGSGKRHRAKLFLGPDRLSALDASLEMLLQIPLQRIRSLSVRPTGTDCSLRVEWAETTAEFL